MYVVVIVVSCYMSLYVVFVISIIFIWFRHERPRNLISAPPKRTVSCTLYPTMSPGLVSWWIFRETSKRFQTQKDDKIIPPGRLTWNIIMEVWFRSCSFLNGWFVSSMLIFQGVLLIVELEFLFVFCFSGCWPGWLPSSTTSSKIQIFHSVIFGQEIFLSSDQEISGNRPVINQSHLPEWYKHHKAFIIYNLQVQCKWVL